MAPRTDPDPEAEIDNIISAKTGDVPATDEAYYTVARVSSNPPIVAPVKPNKPQSASPEPVKTVVPPTSGFRTLPDGSLRGVITISVENSELLRTWAEGAGTDLTEYINEHVNEALMAYAASTSEA